MNAGRTQLALRRRHHRRRPQRPRLRVAISPARARSVRARAAQRPRRRRGDRGIPSGLPQFDRELHGEPAQSQGDPRPAASPSTGCAIVERPFVEFPAAAGRRLSQGRAAGSTPTQARSRAIFAARRRARCPRITRCSIASPTCCAICCSRRRPMSAAACTTLLAAWKVGEALPRARPRRAARRARPVHQERGRRARPLVRVRADQGGVRLRCDRRQLREPVYAGLGLRAAAPCLRRGERQARRSGATRSAAWARSRRRWRRNAPRAA